MTHEIILLGPSVVLNLILTKRPQIKLTSGYKTHMWHMCSETKSSETKDRPTCKSPSLVSSHLYAKVQAKGGKSLTTGRKSKNYRIVVFTLSRDLSLPIGSAGP